ncbi:hypothetical protein [Burkholderia pyrrocinia]|uniref:hypothetical protein n=1 Tax=Burkholderia pyrrocinia TaxID=60550 RepID=UPI0010465B37|nr:hypothetical protein [Burkholderia pyrrocinia]TDA49194.1 hypothetical protein EVG18_01190 [Burkholderia pyrrocinia]
MPTLTYEKLTVRAERTIRQLMVRSHDEARGAIAMWEDLTTEMLTFKRVDYEADQARLWALIKLMDALRTAESELKPVDLKKLEKVVSDAEALQARLAASYH